MSPNPLFSFAFLVTSSLAAEAWGPGAMGGGGWPGGAPAGAPAGAPGGWGAAGGT